jgi:hypothetical protein
MRIFVGILLIITAMSMAVADVLQSNAPHVVASRDGRCYAKSVPAEDFGSSGVTSVYRVEGGVDTLLHSYDWYSQGLWIRYFGRQGSPPGVSLVRLDPTGNLPAEAALAIAFYMDGKLLKKYSTLDIASRPDNVKRGTVYYGMIQHVEGYAWDESHDKILWIATVDGRLLSFDPNTGELLRTRRIESSRK